MLFTASLSDSQLSMSLVCLSPDHRGPLLPNANLEETVHHGFRLNGL